MATLDEISGALRRGEVIGLPTDTVYGVAAGPRHPEAIERIFTLKGRPHDKPIGLLVADSPAASEMVELPGYAVEWTRTFWPGPLNLVGLARFDLPEGVGDRNRGTVAVRVPDHPVTRQILAAYGPLAVTSANRSGGPETLDHVAALAALGDLVDLYVEGRCPGAVASTTVDVTGPEPVLLRKGPLHLELGL